ncbi:hypothetical protein AB9F43_32065 [Rhizobium leguminosarum]|uniref:hypothetical protein n=1 Tax=Rhizobium leguminosarum TaxID=384 RepID=UPI003F9BF5D2
MRDAYHRPLDVLDEEAVQDADVVFNACTLVPLVIGIERITIRRWRQGDELGFFHPVSIAYFNGGDGLFLLRSKAGPIAEQFMQRQDFVGIDRLICDVLGGRRSQMPLCPKVLKQFRELPLAIGKCLVAERGEAGFPHPPQSPWKRGNRKCFKHRLPQRGELQAGKAGIAIEITAFGIVIFGDIGRNAIEMSADIGNFGFAENPEEQGKARDLLLLGDRWTAECGTVILERFRMQPENTSAFTGDDATGEIVRNEELDFVPEIENGQKPFPFGTICIRLHDFSLRSCKIGSRFLLATIAAQNQRPW